MALGMLFRGAGLGLKAAFGTTAGRMLTGAGAGALYGGFASDSNTSTGRLRGAVEGAAVGLGLGIGASALIKAPGAIWRNRAALGRAAASSGSFLGKGAGRLGRAAYFNPYATIGIAGAGLGLYGLTRTGLQESNMSTEEMSLIAQRANISSTGFDPGMGTGRIQQDRNMFVESTFGLVQGMHQGRHRG